jgi:hypothetical protein
MLAALIRVDLDRSAAPATQLSPRAPRGEQLLVALDDNSGSNGDSRAAFLAMFLRILRQPIRTIPAGLLRMPTTTATVTATLTSP